jgi:hypothetical protein
MSDELFDVTYVIPEYGRRGSMYERAGGCVVKSHKGTTMNGNENESLRNHMFPWLETAFN